MMNQEARDPQRLPKGGDHMADTVKVSTDKPGFVKPGGGRNRKEEGMDSMPEFTGLTSYNAAMATPPRTDYGQDVPPPANKSAAPSIGVK